MYSPTTRLLTILELLQTRPSMSGEELAQRLEVEPRTIRRYIQMLQDMGMPIEGARGPGGGYRLRPGFKLPPLLFTEEEATAVVLGLLGAHWLEIEISPVAVEGALAKVYRVLPFHGRERLQAISSNIMLSPHQNETRPDASLLVKLSTAIHEQHIVALEYCSHYNVVTQREVEPYGLLGWRGHWHLVAYCRLRKDYRQFRLDRIQRMEVLADKFVKDESFDYQEFIHKHFLAVPARWHVQVEFQAALHLVRHKIPSSYGTLTPTKAGTLFETTYFSLDELARYLLVIGFPFVVHQPAELRDAIRKLGQNLLQIADTVPPEPQRE
uniref:Transcriptional regulator n=1 Tax=Thermosporothrix sp. COM3 TaxID=2490863 RepID=A0A455SH16_9CHLR|nr:transcriptional regulator [Thermosporothrix sp. COM3]